MKPINPSAIVTLARVSPYNEERKKAYKTEALRWLRAIAKRLELNKKDYDIRFNPGGIAVSGEATLHHEKVYIQTSETGIMWRTCDGRKDYIGGPNRWLVGFGGHGDMEKFVAEINSVIK